MSRAINKTKFISDGVGLCAIPANHCLAEVGSLVSMSSKSLRRLSLLIGILALAQFARALPAQDPSIVILYGDSITVGYNTETNFTVASGNGRTVMQLSGSQPLVAMNDLLNNAEEKRSSIAVNWGAGGTTSDYGVDHISSSLISTQNQHQGRHYYVLIMYGTNDIAGGLSSSDTAFNVRQMINAVRARGATFTPVVSTITPRDDRAVEPINSKLVPEAAKDNTTLVNSYSAFISHPTGWRSLLGTETSFLTGQPIQLHPNVAGYNVIAQTWMDEALAALIEPDPAQPVAPTGAIYLLLLGD